MRGEYLLYGLPLVYWLFSAGGYLLAILISVFKRPEKSVRRYIKMFNDVADQNEILRDQNKLLTNERDFFKTECDMNSAKLVELERNEKNNARLISGLVDDKKELSSKVENMYQEMIKMKGKHGEL